MNFAFFDSLKPGAKKAISRGTGKYRKYAVDINGSGTYIAAVKNGRALDWVKVIRNQSRPIKEMR